VERDEEQRNEAEQRRATAVKSGHVGRPKPLRGGRFKVAVVDPGLPNELLDEPEAPAGRGGKRRQQKGRKSQREERKRPAR